MATSTAALMKMLGKKAPASRGSAPIVVKVPSPAQALSRKQKMAGLARRAGGAAKAAAIRERALLFALGGAALIGGAKRTGVNLPKVEALGMAGTYGIGLYAAGRLFKSKVLEELSVGPLCVAMAALVEGGTAGLSSAGAPTDKDKGGGRVEGRI